MTVYGARFKCHICKVFFEKVPLAVHKNKTKAHKCIYLWEIHNLKPYVNYFKPVVVASYVFAGSMTCVNIYMAGICSILHKSLIREYTVKTSKLIISNYKFHTLRFFFIVTSIYRAEFKNTLRWYGNILHENVRFLFLLCFSTV